MKLQTKAPGFAWALVALTLAVSSCADGDVAGRVLLVEAEGAVAGLVYLDQNGNQVRDAADQPVTDLEIRVLVAGTHTVAGSAVTDENGIFVVEGIPVGRLRIEVDGDFLGDSLGIFDFDATEATLIAGDTLITTMGVTFPSFTLAEARSLPEGRKGFVEGIVLNPRTPFGDGALHLQSGDTYLRVLGAQRSVTLLAGDSVRILGRTMRQVGLPVIRAELPFLLAQQVVLPLPLELTTATAAGADGGQRDAALVRIRDARIVDTATITGPFGRDLHMTVDDGSGVLDIVLGEFGGFNLSQVHPDSFSVRQATGLLVPMQTAEGNTWRMYPRTSADLAIQAIPFPGMVIDLTVVAATNSTVTLNWTEVGDGFGNPSDYTVRYRPSSTLAWSQVQDGECAAPVAGSVVGEVIACVVDGLQPATVYFFQVRAFRGTLGIDAQFGPWSNPGGGATAP